MRSASDAIEQAFAAVAGAIAGAESFDARVRRNFFAKLQNFPAGQANATLHALSAQGLVGGGAQPIGLFFFRDRLREAAAEFDDLFDRLLRRFRPVPAHARASTNPGFQHWLIPNPVARLLKWMVGIILEGAAEIINADVAIHESDWRVEQGGRKSRIAKDAAGAGAMPLIPLRTEVLRLVMTNLRDGRRFVE